MAPATRGNLCNDTRKTSPARRRSGSVRIASNVQAQSPDPADLTTTRTSPHARRLHLTLAPRGCAISPHSHTLAFAEAAPLACDARIKVCARPASTRDRLPGPSSDKQQLTQKVRARLCCLSVCPCVCASSCATRRAQPSPAHSPQPEPLPVVCSLLIMGLGGSRAASVAAAPAAASTRATEEAAAAAAAAARTRPEEGAGED